MDWETRIELIASLVVFFVLMTICLIKKARKKPFAFSAHENPPDVFAADKLTVRCDNFRFTLNYELFALAGDEKQPIGFFEESTKWYTGIINFFYHLYSIIGFTVALKDLAGRTIQVYRQGFGVLSTNFRVYDPAGNLLAHFQNKMKRGKDLWETGIYTIKIFDPAGTQTGYMKADIYERRYKVFDMADGLLCQIDKPFKNLPWSGQEAKTMAEESFFIDDKFQVQFHGAADHLVRKTAFAAILYVAVNYYQEVNA